MSNLSKNNQGFIVIGMDFDTNYGKPIPACFQFDYNGYEISVSTGAVKPSSGMTHSFLQPILITNLSTEEEMQINGSVQEAIDQVNRLTNTGKINPKFKIGDVLLDKVSGKAGKVVNMYWSAGDDLNPAEWSYSIDSLGFYFYGESDLVLK